jgi:hypothetical protein
MLSAAGFTDVTVTSEKGFELEDVVSDDFTREFLANTGATDAELRAAAAQFRSIRVQAVRPVQTQGA